MYKLLLRALLALLPTLSLLLASGPILAEDDDAPREFLTLDELSQRIDSMLTTNFSKRGADSCLRCHDDEGEIPITPMFKTPHAVIDDDRTPFAQQQCESCHGPGGEHEKNTRRGERKPPMFTFGQQAWTPIADQNQRCLNCHQDYKRANWHGSSHEFADVACASCHTIHAARDPVLAHGQQDKVCYTCHANQRIHFGKNSRHPVAEGRMLCSDCHNPHSDRSGGLPLTAETRRLCTSCHAEKRGPFLWEHQPAAEDCTLCHTSHGSSLPALLKRRPPQLCQECHSSTGHPSVALNGKKLTTAYLAVKGCTNCHSQVHGSNHPAGVTGLR
jgi:DmsE family decaheme c-type cytochrome